MGWIRAHPYASLFALAGLALVVFVALLFPRLDSLTQGPTAMPTGSLFPTSDAISNTPDTSVTVETVLPRYDTSGNVTGSLPPSQTAPQQAQDASDSALSAFLSSLSAPPSGSAPDMSATDTLLQEITAFIPRGVTVFGGTRTKARTQEQEALFHYGNEAGLAILSFEDSNTDMVERLKNWFENRKSDPSKASVERIANDMAAAGTALAALLDVPDVAREANQNLAKSLQAAALDLKAVTAASGDSATFDAMKTYNTSAEEFIRSYLALADIFTLHEVSFSASDTGSAFTFPAQSGL